MRKELSMQTAIVLDELPAEVLKEIKKNQSDLAKIESALRRADVKLAVYFDKITDPEKQIEFIAGNIFVFFSERRSNKK